MRLTIIATTALALAACGRDDAATAEIAAEDEVAFETQEEAGDVTAIDAATNADAEMAPAEEVE